MRYRLLSAVFLALGVVSAPLGCGSVSVTPPRTAAKAEARPRDCAVEFLRTAPERTYDELGEIYSYYSRVVEPQEVLREKACELGADAVVVTRDFLVTTSSRFPDRKLVAGTALKYRDVTGVPVPPP
jgi:hypothetical protein